MRLSGKVVNGRIELETEAPLPEGALVEVTIGEAEAEYELTEEEEELLWQSDQEIERGEFVTAEDLIAAIRATRRGQ